MAREKKATDEQIVAALIGQGTIKEAAAVVGVSERTIYARMNDSSFKMVYEAAKADIIRNAVYNINNQLQAAINTIVEVMEDQDNNPAVRLQAAQTILNNAGKIAQRLNTNEHNIAFYSVPF